MDDCVVIAIHCGHCLAFCRPGAESWIAVGNYPYWFEDIIFYNGKLYAITSQFDLMLVELGSHPKVTSCSITPPKVELSFTSFYLVECLRELLMAIKCCTFKIFKLDPKGPCWIKIEDLDDQMLFIGTRIGFSLSALDYPGFKGNYIYFTDDSNNGLASVFHLEDSSSIETFSSNCSHSSPSLPI
ncbi:putative F-box protein At5g55150 [Macadamia integrifolia]|uniref:putative F-box protein At5g55150 n=1 Tax=Macadamia integrifolia TaxID=60698 RepID=UPI001C533E99|nr:putative F-box protein At5g55150 [Macadamia integrifolia]